MYRYLIYPIFVALIFCSFTEAGAGKGKKSCWKKLEKLVAVHNEVSKEILQMERFGPSNKDFSKHGRLASVAKRSFGDLSREYVNEGCSNKTGYPPLLPTYHGPGKKDPGKKSKR